MELLDAMSMARVLVVDDEPAHVEILSELLSDDHKVYIATNGQDAINLAHKLMPDLILLDIMLPDLDGFEVCKQLKASPATQPIPIVFVTALGDSGNEKEGFDVGALDYIIKPLNPVITKTRVNNFITLKRQQDQLQHLAYIDSLTNIANRRRFDLTLEEEWRRGKRSGLPLSMLMIDIDYFKLYNDHYGHGVGDYCLKEVARVLSHEVARAGDTLARYGGEEFACIMPNTSKREALHLANRLLDAIRALGLPHKKSPVAKIITVSMGLDTIVPGNKLTPYDLIKNADTALYKSKSSGRNRITL